MEKLLELLNEWSRKALKNKCNWTDVYDEEGVYFLNILDRDMTMEMEDVISKRNGFIKWLVENDKINLEKLRDLDIADNFNYEYFNKNKSDFLISLLSISDTPIEDLISYLK